MLDLSNGRAAALPGWANESKGGVTLAVAPAAQRFVLRGETAIEVAGEALGIALPAKPLTSVTDADRSALWLGPDEWLLIAETQSPALHDGLAAALHSLAGSLVDVSHRQEGIIVSGPNAATALSMFVPLDLALAAFPVGMSTRTIFEKADIMLWRRGEDAFHLEVWRSFAPYVATLLDHARDELAADAATSAST